MNNCPICGKEVNAYHEVTFKEPYTHSNPFDGMFIYGAYSSPKETICFEDNFLHFAFYDANDNLVDHRLVKLGVESPTTKCPSDEYYEAMMQAEECLNNDGSGIDYENPNRIKVEDWDGGEELPF